MSSHQFLFFTYFFSLSYSLLASDERNVGRHEKFVNMKKTEKIENVVIRSTFFFLIDKNKYIIKHKRKTSKRSQSTKVPKHTQEVYKEEPKKLENKTKDKTAIEGPAAQRRKLNKNVYLVPNQVIKSTKEFVFSTL